MIRGLIDWVQIFYIYLKKLCQLLLLLFFEFEALPITIDSRLSKNIY